MKHFLFGILVGLFSFGGWVFSAVLLVQQKDIPATAQVVKDYVPEASLTTDEQFDTVLYVLGGIIETESGFNASAISKTKDYGLGQISGEYMDYYLNKFWVFNRPFDWRNPAHNLFLTTAILYNRYNRVGRDIDNAVRAYHAGVRGSDRAYAYQYSERVKSNVSILGDTVNVALAN